MGLSRQTWCSKHGGGAYTSSGGPRYHGGCDGRGGGYISLLIWNIYRDLRMVYLVVGVMLGILLGRFYRSVSVIVRLPSILVMTVALFSVFYGVVRAIFGYVCVTRRAVRPRATFVVAHRVPRANATLLRIPSGRVQIFGHLVVYGVIRQGVSRGSFMGAFVRLFFRLGVMNIYGNGVVRGLVVYLIMVDCKGWRVCYGRRG